MLNLCELLKVFVEKNQYICIDMKKMIPYNEPRGNKVTISLSDRELDAINSYCKKYKVASRAAVIREGAVRFVMERFLNDYPTLFAKSELDQLIVQKEDE